MVNDTSTGPETEVESAPDTTPSASTTSLPYDLSLEEFPPIHLEIKGTIIMKGTYNPKALELLVIRCD